MWTRLRQVGKWVAVLLAPTFFWLLCNSAHHECSGGRFLEKRAFINALDRYWRAHRVYPLDWSAELENEFQNSCEELKLPPLRRSRYVIVFPVRTLEEAVQRAGTTRSTFIYCPILDGSGNPLSYLVLRTLEDGRLARQEDSNELVIQMAGNEQLLLQATNGYSSLLKDRAECKLAKTEVDSSRAAAGLPKLGRKEHVWFAH